MRAHVVRVLLLAAISAGCTKKRRATSDTVATDSVAAPLIWTGRSLLAADDTSRADFYGVSVHLNDDLALVGASNHTSDGPGAVYAFGWSANGWTQEQKLVPSTGDVATNFGRTLARDGDTLLAGIETGAYAFVRNAGVWSEQQLLDPGTVECESVSVSGNTAFLGIPRENNYEGAVHVFERTGDVWAEVQTLTRAGGLFPRFGQAVLVDGNEAFIGHVNEGASGLVIDYRRVGGAWTEHQVLEPSDAGSGVFRFGSELALNDDTMVVGATAEGHFADGAYVFVRSGDMWVEQAKLQRSDQEDDDYEAFGVSVAVDGDIAVIGATFHALTPTSEAGAAHVFTRQNDAWTETQILTLDNPFHYDLFGRSVAVDDGVVIVGAPNGDTPSFEVTGTVSTFVLVGASCSEPDTCGTQLCVDGVCCNEVCDGPCDTCNIPGSEGICSPAPHGSVVLGCGPYVCDGAQGACPLACRYDSDCAAGFYCPSGPELGDCVPQFSLGASCGAERECDSANCIDGLCCDRPCTGSCASCTLSGSAGTCSPVAEGSTSDACRPYVCDGQSMTCPEACIDESACPDGFACNEVEGVCTDGPICDGSHTIHVPGEAPLDCEPYRCSVEDRCLAACTTSADCVVGSVCHADGRCVLPRERSVITGCGGCAVGGRGTSTPWWWLLGAAALMSRRERRRHH